MNQRWSLSARNLQTRQQGESEKEVTPGGAPVGGSLPSQMNPPGEVSLLLPSVSVLVC